MMNALGIWRTNINLSVMKDFENLKKALKKSMYANSERYPVFVCVMDGHEIYRLKSKFKGKVGMSPYIYLENNSIIRLSLDDTIIALNIYEQNQEDNSN